MDSVKLAFEGSHKHDCVLHKRGGMGQGDYPILLYDVLLYGVLLHSSQNGAEKMFC